MIKKTCQNCLYYIKPTVFCSLGSPLPQRFCEKYDEEEAYDECKWNPENDAQNGMAKWVQNFDDVDVHWEQLEHSDFATLPYIKDGVLHQARSHLSIWLDTRPVLKEQVKMKYPHLCIE